MLNTRTIIMTILSVVILSSLAISVVAKDEEDPLIGTEAADFELPVLFQDGTIVLSDYEGETPVVLDYFETWCSNCRKNLPLLEEFNQKHGDEVEVFIITHAKDIEVLEEFFTDEENKISFKVLLDTEVETIDDYPHKFIPYTVVIDIDGWIIDTHTGADKNLVKTLEKSLGLKKN